MNILESNHLFTQIGLHEKQITTSMSRLSSAKRINSASDDASGLAVSQKMRRQVHALNQGVRNLQDGANLLNTADGATAVGLDILNRIKELGVKGKSDTLNEFDHKVIGEEVNELLVEFDRIAQETSFNGKILLTGNMGINLESGVGEEPLYVTLGSMQTWDVGLYHFQLEEANAIDSTEKSSLLVEAVEGAIEMVSAIRGQIGGYQNRIEHTLNRVTTMETNLSTAESKITDVDVAKELMTLTKNQLLKQSAQAMMTHQVNSNQQVLKLISM